MQLNGMENEMTRCDGNLNRTPGNQFYRDDIDLAGTKIIKCPRNLFASI